jgi:hypothetical protein
LQALATSAGRITHRVESVLAAKHARLMIVWDDATADFDLFASPGNDRASGIHQS